MKVWYSIYNRKAYRGVEPGFYSRDGFKWVEIIESNYSEIKKELVDHLTLNPNFNKSDLNQRVNYHGKWKTMPLMTWGVEFHNNMVNFPNTTKILAQIPDLVSASFNLLEGKAEIKKHFGETNASVRVHLGLYVPGELPHVGLQVKGISESWEEGKAILFCDAFEHSAWNYSDQDRYILLLDIIRPEFLTKKNIICAHVLGTLSLQGVTTKNSILFYLTFPLLVVIHFLASISALILTPLRNFTFKKRVTTRVTR